MVESTWRILRAFPRLGMALGWALRNTQLANIASRPARMPGAEPIAPAPIYTCVIDSLRAKSTCPVGILPTKEATLTVGRAPRHRKAISPAVRRGGVNKSQFLINMPPFTEYPKAD